MLKLIFPALIILLIGFQSNAQLTFGPGVGISTLRIPGQTFVINDKNHNDSIRLSYFDADYGYHFGAFVRYKFSSFLIQPEVYFNSNKTTYKIRGFGSATIVDSIKKERYQHLDLGLMLGYKIGIVRFMVGPLAHVFIHSRSDLTSIDGFKDNWQKSTLAYQLGIGFDLSKLAFDLRWEQNFTKYGDHLEIDGVKYSFSKAPTKLVALLSYMF
ncbi:MAG: PorT family protein [Saprospiraceae bacterium]|nr:PorT family protein [Saprospiraceae bacterium]